MGGPEFWRGRIGRLALRAIFWLRVTPRAALRRALGKDRLGLAVDPAAGSYWVRRDPARPIDLTDPT